MTQVHEISRVRQIETKWVVEILSAATGRWIVQGVWGSKQAADSDRKNWM